MQCDETISHFVTAGRSHFRTLRNACVTAGKTNMTAGKIYHGCFEMLSWPHRTSANIINICFWLLETCTKCSYFMEENIRPGAQRLAFEVRVYHTPATNIPWGGGLRLGTFAGNRRLMCFTWPFLELNLFEWTQPFVHKQATPLAPLWRSCLVFKTEGVVYILFNQH